jgi:hypothetical protein
LSRDEKITKKRSIKSSRLWREGGQNCFGMKRSRRKGSWNRPDYEEKVDKIVQGWKDHEEKVDKIVQEWKDHEKKVDKIV